MHDANFCLLDAGTQYHRFARAESCDRDVPPACCIISPIGSLTEGRADRALTQYLHLPAHFSIEMAV